MCAQHASREAPTGIVANVKCKLLLPHTDPFSSIIATVCGHQHERANLSLYILAEKCKTLFAVFLADISFFQQIKQISFLQVPMYTPPVLNDVINFKFAFN